MKARDGNIELLRLVLMFLICMIHAVGYVDARWCHWLTNVSFVGVIGFVLISGFYGMRFSLWKVIKLEGVAVGCAVTVVTVAAVSDHLGFSACLPPFGHAWGREVLALFKGYWFVHAYVVMMCLAPLAERVFADAQSSPQGRRVALWTCIPFLAMIYGWSFAMLIPVVQNLVPRTEGLVPFSGFTLFAAYLVGRLYRVFDGDKLLKGRWLLPTALACGFVASLWYGLFARYNSPFLLVLAVGIFWAFRRLRVPESFASALRCLTPSVLSVYLLHCNRFGYQAFAFMEGEIRPCLEWDYLVFLSLAIVAFIGGFVLDIPRRMLARCARWRCVCTLLYSHKGLKKG